LIKSRWRTESSTSTLTADANGESGSRNSNGLNQFFLSIQDLENLSLLDFGGASQANVTFITNLGHRIYTEDVLRSIDDVFGSDPEMQSNPVRVEMFLNQVLDFPEEHFDGVLVWDVLQFLSPVAAQAMVDRLRRVLRPQAYLLAFFNANEKVPAVPEFTYRISDQKTLLLTQRGVRPPAQFFNNRNIEKLFQKYQSIKFFLTRNSLREVIVRR
jgi:SAM-dependent methyltransferase